MYEFFREVLQQRIVGCNSEQRIEKVLKNSMFFLNGECSHLFDTYYEDYYDDWQYEVDGAKPVKKDRKKSKESRIVDLTEYYSTRNPFEEELIWQKLKDEEKKLKDMSRGNFDEICNVNDENIEI